MTKHTFRKLTTEDGIEPTCEHCQKILKIGTKVLSKRTGRAKKTKHYCEICKKLLGIWS